MFAKRVPLTVLKFFPLLFDLTDAERSFADRDRPHDRASVTTHLAHSLVSGLRGGRTYPERLPIIRRVAVGDLDCPSPPIIGWILAA